MLSVEHQSAEADYYTRPRPSILAHVATGPHRVLDLGCGAGMVGRGLMAAGKAAEVVGVELFEPAAAEAARHYRTVYTGDLEAMDLPFDRAFDYVLCGDILEHLKEPALVVQRIRGWLKDDGVFICSVPNIRHWRILFDLAFRGAWEYTDAGILDRTHLRFFTRRSCHAMLSGAGFAVVSTQTLISGRRYQWLNRLTGGLFEDLLGAQFVVAARKAGTTAPQG